MSKITLKKIGNILITGFEPFGKHKSNPSAKIAKYLNGKTINGMLIHGKILPVSYSRSKTTIIKLIKQLKPKVIISFGLAENRRGFSIERIAVNIDDANLPDNDRNKLKAKRIEFNGSAAYWSGLPVDKIATVLRRKGIDAYVSNHAGTYVCNHLMYSVLHYIALKKLKISAGFVHVPFLSKKLLIRGANEIVKLAIKPAISAYFDSMAGILNTKGKLTQALLKERRKEKEFEDKKWSKI